MNHADHVGLLREGIPTTGGIWADLGAGEGAFTLALAELVGPTGQLYAVDKDSSALARQAAAMKKQFPSANVTYLTADFTQPLILPLLDGIVMANALHFVPYAKQSTLLQRLKIHLQPKGRFLLVEYNADQGNTWVPYPLSYASWEKLAAECGFEEIHQLKVVPSRFLGAMYSAIALG